MSERYKVRGSYIELFSVFDTELKMTLCSACFPEDANKIATALNADPQAEKAREIIERAEKAIMRVASQTDVSVGADTEPGCWWCEAPDGEDHASDCEGYKLLADIAAYKEG